MRWTQEMRESSYPLLRQRLLLRATTTTTTTTTITTTTHHNHNNNNQYHNHNDDANNDHNNDSSSSSSKLNIMAIAITNIFFLMITIMAVGGLGFTDICAILLLSLWSTITDTMLRLHALLFVRGASSPRYADL